MAKMLRRTLKFGIFLMLAACLALPAMAAGGNLADVEIGGTTIHLNALAAGKMSLRVSGPGDFAYEAASKGGEGFVFEIFDAEGGLLPDGTYTYELTALGAKPKAAEAENLRGLRGSEAARTQSGAFTIRNGALVDPGLEEPIERPNQKGLAVPNKDIVHLDDTIIDGSACVGFDCVNGENFGFDTLRLKENNLRIHFDDTSNSGSFPSNDWRIVANDSSNGGSSYLAIEDSTAGRNPFRVEAGARANALVVEADGDIGIGTLNPAVDLEIETGNTPTLRLNQDGSSGFTSQTWDVAGNEANFFVRDVTNGSKLSFRIRPGAPESSIDIAASGDVGVGTSSPSASMEVKRSTGADATLLQLTNNSGTRIQFENTGTPTASTNDWVVSAVNAGFRISRVSSGATEMEVDNDGNLTVSGNITATTTGSSIPDYVFGDDYPLMPLTDLKAFIQENKHLPNIPSAEKIGAGGGALNMTQMQIRLLEKVEELTLYTLQLEDRVRELEAPQQ